MMPHMQHATRWRWRTKIAPRAPWRLTQQPPSTVAAAHQLARAGRPAAPPAEPPISRQPRAFALDSAATGTRRQRRHAAWLPPFSPGRPPPNRSCSTTPARRSNKRTASAAGEWHKAGEHGKRADHSNPHHAQHAAGVGRGRVGRGCGVVPRRLLEQSPHHLDQLGRRFLRDQRVVLGRPWSSWSGRELGPGRFTCRNHTRAREHELCGYGAGGWAIISMDAGWGHIPSRPKNP